MVDLTTTYLGLKLKNPLVASPLLVENGLCEENGGGRIAAIVMHSLFEEQIIHESLELDYFLTRGTETFPEALTYLPDLGDYSIGPETYLERLNQLKRGVNIPVIGSLNGVSTGGWIEYAKRIEEAGADALELNLYYLPTDPNLTAVELEDNYIQLVRDVREQVSIPIAVKLSPFFTSIPNIARRFGEAGVNGLVLFNRFYQPDFDLQNLDVFPNLVLSNSNELRLPLRWISLLYGQIPVDFALTSGVHTAEDVIKAVMAGANVAMTTSELLQNGIPRISQILTDLLVWMEENEYQSVEQMRGSMSKASGAASAAYERVNYMKVLNSFDTYYR
jgi:dihydroorotate dehydrogenase (fumarate)